MDGFNGVYSGLGLLLNLSAKKCSFILDQSENFGLSVLTSLKITNINYLLFVVEGVLELLLEILQILILGVKGLFTTRAVLFDSLLHLG